MEARTRGPEAEQQTDGHDAGSAAEKAEASTGKEEGGSRSRGAGGGPPLRILSVNVTLLTKQRLLDTLAAAVEAQADVVALQETRHPRGGWYWAEGPARRAGYAIQWSPEAGLVAGGAQRKPGGTALLWKPELGKSTAVATDSHRLVARTFAFGTVVVGYGDAGRIDLPWLHAAILAAQAHAGVSLVVGDFNWRKAYEVVLQASWTSPEAVATVLRGPAAPTRCLGLGISEWGKTEVAPLPGIPHHAAVLFQAFFGGGGAEAGQPQEQRRLQRCAGYSWTADAKEASEVASQEALRAAADAAAPAPHSVDSLAGAWEAWHARAEAVYNEAWRRGWVVKDGKAERPKGSQAQTRPAAKGAVHRPDEPIKLRRARRLHRAAAEQWRRKQQRLTREQARHWESAARDKLCEELPRDQAHALDMCNDMIAQLAKEQRREEASQWRRKFANWTNDVVRLAKPVLKGHAEQAAFDAEEMRKHWEEFWCPENDDALARRWRELAREAGLEEVEERRWVAPTLQDLVDSLRKTNGAPGMDGWKKEELLGLHEHACWVFRELYDLLLYTNSVAEAAEEGDGQELRELLLFLWRIVGIPKKGSPEEPRPIAVGSLILRAWDRLQLQQLPRQIEDQWCGRRGLGTLAATAHWLAEGAVEGAELDLRKAFDLVRGCVAHEALRFFGVPVATRRWLSWGAWGGQRWTHVRGEVAGPIWPTSGLPPGCPCSPQVLAMVLAPWPRLVKQRVPRARCWLWMDDRSIALKDAAAAAACSDRAMDEALETTSGFDAAVGLQENVKKRQRWRHQEEVEHLGLRCRPGAVAPPIPKDNWEGVREIVDLLAMLPGSMRLRAAAAALFVAPKIFWCAPLSGLPPKDLEARMRKAITRSACTWWCRGRWWADRVATHPRLGHAYRGLTGTRQLGSSRPAAALRGLEAQAAIVGLQVHRWDETGLWLKPARGADPRVRAAAAAAAAEGPAAPQPPRAASGPATTQPHFAPQSREGMEGVEDAWVQSNLHPSMEQLLMSQSEADVQEGAAAAPAAAAETGAAHGPAGHPGSARGRAASGVPEAAATAATGGVGRGPRHRAPPGRPTPPLPSAATGGSGASAIGPTRGPGGGTGPRGTPPSAAAAENGNDCRASRAAGPVPATATAGAEGAPEIFLAHLGASQHAIRSCARVAALQTANRGREDVEGIDDVDVELASMKKWKRWREQLAPGDATALEVWRGGAVFTPTRRWAYRPGPAADANSKCSHCPEGLGSARHLWAECPGLEADRRRITAKHNVPWAFWKEAPRVTAKSGWVVRSAAGSAELRLRMLLAANEMGVVVVKRAYPHESEDGEVERPRLGA